MSTAERLRCPHCEFDNAVDWRTCFRCRRDLREGERVTVERRMSWGQELLEKPRPGVEIECRSCGAQTPHRYAFCVRCGRAPSADPSGLRRCPTCEAWCQRADKFCERCGDPTSATGDPSTWRPDGCPGCFADSAVDARYCGDCGAAYPVGLGARRELLRELCTRRVRGDFRHAQRLPELHPARAEAVLREEDHAVWVTLHASDVGAIDVELVVSATAGEAPALPGSVVRLARWIRRQLVRTDPAQRALEARVKAAASEDERVLSVESAGDALRLSIGSRDAPSPSRLQAWVELAARIWRSIPSVR